MAYYAGHVIGAAMIYCTIGSATVLYTGDYNMVSDRLLGAAKVPRLCPDVLITESTYATTLRDARRSREGKLLDAIHSVIKNGGKVLVPVFAVGSAQEMSLLIDSFWQRMHLTVRLHILLKTLSVCTMLHSCCSDEYLCVTYVQRVFGGRASHYVHC
jgi:integrator complex subunit 11